MKWLQAVISEQAGGPVHMAGAALPHPDCRRRFTEEVCAATHFTSCRKTGSPNRLPCLPLRLQASSAHESSRRRASLLARDAP